MDILQEALTLAEQERDAQQQLRTVADAARATAEATVAQALLDLAQAQATAATANAAVLAAGVAAAGNVTFALSPALASSTLLNYQSGEGIKIYGKATAPLESLFNGDSGALRLFLSKVKHRATQFGWTAILNISQDGKTYNFFDHYGQVTKDSLKAQALMTAAANDRDTQNSSQMYTFLITSISDGLLGKVISKKEDYTTASGFEDGPSLLKVIVTISHVDTRAQAGFIRQCLARLSITILTPEYNCNIRKLNEYVIVLEEGLAARGEASHDTLMNVHAAYINCKDADFVRHAKDEYARWEQGASMTLKEYMDSAGTKYETLVMKGQWEAPSPEQEQILALTAAVSSLRSKATKSGGGGASKGKDAAALGKLARKNDGVYAWKDVAPKAGEAIKKEVKGKTYFWCTRHKQPQWSLHNPSAFPNLCKYHPNYAALETAWKASTGDTDVRTKTNKDATAEDMKLSTALAAIQDSDDNSVTSHE
jgi:YHS domain-containing protein